MRSLMVPLALLASGCGSVYERQVPAPTDVAATDEVARQLPPLEATLLRGWQARHPAGGDLTVARALRDQQQTLRREMKAQADSAEFGCVLLRSQGPEPKGEPAPVRPDPLHPAAAAKGPLPPCEAMAYYQGIVAEIDRIVIRLPDDKKDGAR